MDKNLLQKAKAPMIALIQTKIIMNDNKLKTKTKRTFAPFFSLFLSLFAIATTAQAQAFGSPSRAIDECKKPTYVTISEIGTSNATLSWTENGEATEWQIMLNDDYDNLIQAPTNPFTLTNLTPGTEYTVKVTPWCEMEKWSDERTFTTQCEPITITADAPYTEGFESPQGTAYNAQGPLPSCWEANSTGNIAPHNTTGYYIEDSQSLSFYYEGASYSNGTNYAYLPEFTNPLNELKISFYMYMRGNNNSCNLQLGYITAENSFFAIETYDYNPFTLQHTVYLLNVPATAQRLAFRWTARSGNDVCIIDNVEVAIDTDCHPVNTLRRGGMTASSAYLSWNLIDNNQEAWDVQVATNAAFTENVANHVAGTHENYLLTGLEAASYYYVRVKPSCSTDLWSNTIDFKTPCEPITITHDSPYFEGFGSPLGIAINGLMPDCWEKYEYSTISWTTNYYAVWPEFSNPISDLTISFRKENDMGSFSLGYITANDDGTCNTFTEIANYGPSPSMIQYTEYLSLLDVPVAAKRLAFRWRKIGDSGMCYIGDVNVSLAPDCYPVGVVSIVGLSTTYAYLSWALIDNTQTEWDVQVATNEAFTENVRNYTTDIHENFLMDSLIPGTLYYARVKPSCSEDQWSDKWFNTYCECCPVFGLRLGEVFYNSAYLSWDLSPTNQASTWNVQVATDEDFTNILADEETDSNENYFVEGLSGNTQYYVRVKPTCSEDQWSRTFSFTTLCGYDITLETPYTEGFEDPTGTLWTQHGLLPPCWEGYNNPSYPTPHNTIGSYGAPHIIHSGAQCLSFCNEDGDSYAILPEFSNPISDLQINFWMATNGNTTDKLRLGYITTEDDGTCNTFTEIASYDSNFGSMVQRSKTLENVPAEAYRLAFKWSTSYYYLCFIDDVEVSINPCANPINLAVGNLTQETADITWEGSLGNYAVRHRTAAHYDGTVIDEPFNIDELPAGWDRYQTTSYGSFSPTQFGWLFTTYGLGAYNMRCRLYDHNTNYWLVTPGFTVGENYTLSFDVALTDHDNDNPPATPCNNQTTFIVQITTDNMSSWQTLREWNNSGSEYVLNNIPHTGQNVSGISLADYAGQNVRIAFHCVRTDYNYDWVNDLHIDNVLIGNPVAVPAGEWTDPVAMTGNMHRLTGLTAGTRYDAQVKSNLGECDNWNDVPTFKTLEENAGKFFLYEGNWNEADNWVPACVPTASDKVTLRADATIPAGIVAFANAIAGTDEHTLTVKDGGQLFHYQNINYQNITVTLEKEIAGHDGSSAAGWHFIGSPVVGVNSVTPSAENGFLVNDYDLYYYDEPTHYWMNHKPGNSNSGFGLTYGSGFLYANDEGTTLKISGKVRYSENYATKTGLTHEAEVLNGFNLVGNPFLHNARVNTTAYVIDNGAVVAYTEGTKIIAPGEGVMVQTTSSFVSFYRVDPDAAALQPKQLQITVSQEAEQRGEASSTTLLDNAIINFEDGGTLEKFDFGRADARVYIPQGGKDYAIVCAEGQNEMPLNFKAIKNGTYTLTFDVENVEFDYLHLIDNLTGADVDLLTPPAGVPPLQRGQGGFNYTFTAKTTDYASRFRLVFSNDDAGEDACEPPFAYISNGNIVINGTGTLQIIDILGKELERKELSTLNSQLSTSSFVPGVYVLRLVGGDTVRTQKIVVGF